MAIIRFEKEGQKQQYQEWRKQNTQGYVLNITTWNPKAKTYKYIIHNASWCSSLNTPSTPNRD